MATLSPGTRSGGVPTPAMSGTAAAATAPDWERRFRAPRVSLPDWAQHAPQRAVFLSNASGTYEIYAWDREAQTRRQVTDRPNGTTTATIDPSGEWVWWFADTDGDEFGVWMRQRFTGGADEPAAPGLAPSYPAGVAIARDGLSVVARSTDEDGSTVHVVRPGREPVEIYRHRESAGVADLSEDGTIVVIEHSEHGDTMHPSLRAVGLDGHLIADLHDGPDLGLSCTGFAPVSGDPRVLVSHQRRGHWEPMLWNPLTGEQTEIDLGLPGDVGVDWYPDASALLVDHNHHARSELYRYDLAESRLTRLDTPPGTVLGATARPDDTVEYLWSSGERASELRSTGGGVVLDPPGERAPHSVPVRDVWVDGPGGAVHALVSSPQGGQGPYPTVFEVHGGPTAHDSDHFAPGVAAWVDHGFAVVRVNYRGSTGYGKEWTDALRERVGLIELEDIAAVRAWAVETGLADPDRLVLSGASWGGYLTLLGLGTQPDLWSLGLAAVPVADYVAAYEDEMEALKAMDRTLMGGSPQQVPQRYAASSPISYVREVTAPVFLSAGLNDPRCPIRQVENYVARLAELGVPHEVYRYEAGHGSAVVEERIRQVRMELDFVGRHLGLPVSH